MEKTAIEWLVEEIVEKYNFRFETYYGQEIQQAKEMEKQQQSYSLNDLKEAFAMGRTNATIKDFNQRFKNK